MNEKTSSSGDEVINMYSNNDKNDKNKIIPDFHSPVRHMINESLGEQNQEFIRNFQLAKKTNNSFVIMEGDWGGQIYLVCPMSMVECDESVLKSLLMDLDKIAWDDAEGIGIYYEIHKVGEVIGGGMGGGLATHELMDSFRLYESKIMQ